MPVVSVIIPVFNGAAFVSPAIQGVLAQTFSDWELIVVDDGSTDHTAQVVGRFSDPRVRCVTQPHGGPSVARNYGLSLARGDYVAFLDADDRWLPGKLFAQVQRFAERPAAGLVYCSAQFFSADGRLIGCEWARVEGQALDALLFDNPITGSASSAMVPRRVFDRMGGFDETLRHVEDWEMWLRIATAYPLAAVRAPLVVITKQPASNSTQYASMSASLLAALERAFQTYAVHRAPLRLQVLARAHALAGIYFSTFGELAQARRAFLAALRLYPWVPGVYARLALTFLGRSFNYSGRRVKDRLRGLLAQRQLRHWETH